MKTFIKFDTKKPPLAISIKLLETKVINFFQGSIPRNLMKSQSNIDFFFNFVA